MNQSTHTHTHSVARTAKWGNGRRYLAVLEENERTREGGGTGDGGREDGAYYLQ